MVKRRSAIRQMGGCFACISIALAACTPQSSDSSPSSSPSVPLTMKLESSAFSANGAIPAKYTCKGENVSPALNWDAPPEKTRSLALIMDDPDAPGGTFVHWVLYDLPSNLRELSEAIDPNPILMQGGTQGKNGFRRYGYGGPCPPGGTHRYFFKLYALDTLLDLPPGASKQEVLAAMQGHVLAGAELMGKFAH